MVEYVAQQKQQELAKLYHQGAQLITVLIAPAAMMLIFFGKDIIYLWSGNINLASKTAPILLPLALGNYLNGLMWMPYQLQLAHGWTSFAIRVNIIAVTLLVPTIFLVTPRFGAVGVAWVWALLNVGYVTVGMHYMYKKLLPAEKWTWYWSDVIKQLLSALTVIAIVNLLINNFIQNSLAKFVIYILVFSVAILLTAWHSNQIKPLMLLNFNNLYNKTQK